MVRVKLARELPFLASEALMMEAVKAGCDRQDVHEAVRRASNEAARVVQSGGENDLAARLERLPLLAPVASGIRALLDPARHVGRAPEQVLEFVASEVDPLLARHAALVGAVGEVRV